MMITLKQEQDDKEKEKSAENPKILLRNPWKIDEDQKLKKIVENASKRDWENISK